MNRISRNLGLVLLLSAGLLPMFACDTMGTPGSSTSRDILEIKDRLDKSIEQQNRAASKQDYLNNSISENMKERNETLQTQIEDLTKQVRSQSEELHTIHSQLQDIVFRLNGSHPGAENQQTAPIPQPAPSGSTSPMPTNPNPAPNPALTSAPAGASAATQAIVDAQKYLEAGDSDSLNKALEGFRTALGMNPNHQETLQAYFGLGETSLKMNDKGAAEENYLKVIKEDKSHPMAWESLERIADIRMEDGKNQKALAILQSIAQRYPQYPNIDRVKANIAKLQGGAEGQ